ncbi:hypothetical protein KUCAC02_032671, partial [Chaenocephalus aceratus]
MDETVKPLRVPPQMSSMLSSLVVEQPADALSFMIALLQRISTDIPRVLLLGPPAVGKHTMAQRLSADLRAVHVTSESLLSDQSELSAQARCVPPTEPLPVDLLVKLVQRRLGEIDCFSRGWVLEGIPQTRLQALSLQQAGVIPEHVVMLEAPEDVLLERSRGKVVDPLTGDVYHQTFILPPDPQVSQRLEHHPAELQRDAELQRHRQELTGLSSAYQNVLRVVNADQPHADVYQQEFPESSCWVLRGAGRVSRPGLLSEKYKMVDVCCEQLLRSVAAEGSTLGEEIHSYLDDRRPVPDSLVLQVLEERLSRVDCSVRGWILHDFPRDLQQARSLQGALQGALQPNRVFFLELADEVCVERTTLRATDPVSGE